MQKSAAATSPIAAACPPEATPVMHESSAMKIAQLEEMIDVQKAMLAQARQRLSDRTNEAAQLRAALAAAQQLQEEEEEEEDSEAHNTTGVLFSVRSSPRRTPPGMAVFLLETPNDYLMRCPAVDC